MLSSLALELSNVFLALEVNGIFRRNGGFDAAGKIHEQARHDSIIELGG